MKQGIITDEMHKDMELYEIQLFKNLCGAIFYYPDENRPVASPINLSESSIRCLIKNLFEMFMSFKIVLL